MHTKTGGWMDGQTHTDTHTPSITQHAQHTDTHIGHPYTSHKCDCPHTSIVMLLLCMPLTALQDLQTTLIDVTCTLIPTKDGRVAHIIHKSHLSTTEGIHHEADVN